MKRLLDKVCSLVGVLPWERYGSYRLATFVGDT